ncbi:hypothetical protein EH223_06605 [candidate division KSB1 bacterium]|nr:hypothetical protein [candidate division KSB1 bacterium]RQW04822.1 MAG: hypothetical protein EH223_06605 [candidate division KSB1 bacterium]
MPLSWDDIERKRDLTFFRIPARQLKDLNDAERFVNKTGFCFAFKMQKSELPCMWHAAAGERYPIYPQHVQHDPYIGLVWDAKDALVADKKVYYGKALKKRPTFISLDFFPAFYRLQKHKNGAADYLSDYMRGQLSSEAKRIMDALSGQSPMVTADLKMASRMAHPAKRAVFDKAMAELQGKMYIVKIAEFYDPFTFLWDILDRRFEREIALSAALSYAQAREKILRRYFENVWISQPVFIHRLFGWTPEEIEKSLYELLNQGVIVDSIHIAGEKKTFYGLAQLN